MKGDITSYLGPVHSTVSFEKLGEDGWAVRDGDSWTGSMESSLALEDKLTACTMGVRKIEICLLLIQES